MGSMRELWDRFWRDTVDTLTEKDILYMVDEIKLEYTLPLVRTLPGKISTLEVGSGSGRLSCFLASHGYHTTCLDYSPNALRVAKNNYRLTKNEGNFIMADAERLPFSDSSFDAVLSTGLLEHFADPQPVVNEMARVLKPGGLFISDIVPEKLLALYQSVYRLQVLLLRIAFRLKRRRLELMYERKLSKQDIQSLLESAGLQGVCVFAAGVVPPPLLLPPRIIPFRKRIQNIYNSIVYSLKPFFRRLDGTILAECFGLYYFASAEKPNAEDVVTRHIGNSESWAEEKS